MFVSSLVDFTSKFWLKFLYSCISHQTGSRNHSYLDQVEVALFYSGMQVHSISVSEHIWVGDSGLGV